MAFPQLFEFGKRLIDGQDLDGALANPIWSYTRPLTATIGGTRTTSTKIVETVANVATVGSSGAGVTLPVALPGKIMLVFNNALNDLRVFADDPSSIDGVSGNVGILVRPQSLTIFVAQVLRTWTFTTFSLYSSSTSDYLSAYSTQTQPIVGASAEQIMTFNTIDSASGISIVSNSQITVSRTGVYNLQFSAQFDKTDSGKDSFEVWLKKNGQVVEETNTIVEMDGNDARLVAAWNFVVPLAAGDYLQLAWWSADVNMRLLARVAQPAVPSVSPYRPAIPSVILTVTGV